MISCDHFHMKLEFFEQFRQQTRTGAFPNRNAATDADDEHGLWWG